MPNNDPEVLLTPKELARRLKTSEQALANRRHAGKPPNFIRLGRTIRYLERDVRDYIDSCRVETKRG